MKPSGGIGFEQLPVTPGEPLRLELESFVKTVRDRTEARVNGEQATAALRLAEGILDKINEHAGLVAETLRAHG